MSIVEAQDLEKSFSTLDVLKGVSFSFEKGKMIAITGASGVGKSTLLNIIGTLDTPSRGKLIICGQPLSKTSFSKLRSDKIGFIFQSYNLIEDETVLQNLLLPAIIARTPRKEAHKKALAFLEQFGLQGRENQLAARLSGGEKQRVAIIRALMNDPELILADEPTGNLDEKNAEIIFNILLQCKQEMGKTVILVTHNEKLAEACDERYVLSEGKLRLQQ